ncbi:MAG TPA: M1 family metallopeptidase [Bacteroidia bacterium]|nr:M1 family metallopeptidase [Bacteroidia bacterium]
MKKQLLLSLSLFAAFAVSAKDYFQQDVAYTINVKLDDIHDELHGNELLIYKNNSPDQLDFIYMHLWPNGYKDNNTPLGKQLKQDGSLFFYYAGDKDRGYIDSLDFKVDGQPAKLEYVEGSPDIAKLILNTPLLPGGQISITTPFHVKIPSGKISRLGHIGQQYQITQWYPKPAVYDKDGWEEIPYLNQGEFYSEFGTYDVFISLPKNYVLGATGDLQDNPEEKKFIEDKVNETKAITAYDEKDDKFPASSDEWKTVHYHQDHVHDFAWFCDKRYHVLKGEVTLPHTGKKVTTWIMYTNQYANLWKNAIEYMDSSVYYYSLWNGDYMYDVCTAVDGALSAGGGMEYPNITVIGGVSSALELDVVITHEVGHNWFYGMLGSNERKHAWMDEGINSANELRYVATRYPNSPLIGGKGPIGKVSHVLGLEDYKRVAEYYQGYAFCARQNIDQPIEMQSADFTSINYGTIVYMKSAIIFTYLRGYLGDSLYDACFQAYFDKWKLHHPMPEDIRAVFEQVSGKDLSWLFVDLIDTNKKLDYKVCGVTDLLDEKKTKLAQGTDLKGNEFCVMVKNCGEIKGPVCLSAIGDDGNILQTVWYDGFTGKVGLMFPKQSQHVHEFRIDGIEMMPEVNRKNNTVRASGLFRKVEPLKLQIAGSLDDPRHSQLFWMPTIGFNKYDKFMIGAAFYNHVVPGKHFEWLAMPMYSVGDNGLVGHADAFLNFNPNGPFQNIRIGASASSYDFHKVLSSEYPLTPTPDRLLRFVKVAPELDLTIRKRIPRSPVTNSFRVRAVYLREDKIFNGFDYNTGADSWYVSPVEKVIYEASYTFRDARSLDPFGFTLTYQNGDNMSKLQLTGDFKLNVARKKDILFRVFAGTFLSNSSDNDYRFRMSGFSPSAVSNQDYLYDNIFFGRTEASGFYHAQFVPEDGGFKMYSAAGQSDKFLAAVNVLIPMPGNNKLINRLNLYGDAGVYTATGVSGTEFMYDAGVKLSLFRGGICDVYFPLVWSSQFTDYKKANGLKYGDLIRFTFILKQFNPSNITNLVRLGS